MPRRPALALLALAVVLAAGPAAAGGSPTSLGLRAEDGWVRQTPPGRDVAAGYVVLHGTAAGDVVLVDARSPAASRIEFHTHAHADGVMRMRRVETVTVPAGGTVAFEPGGLHLMIFGTDATRAGREIAVTLIAEDGGEATLTLPVRRHGPSAATGDPR